MLVPPASGTRRPAQFLQRLLQQPAVILVVQGALQDLLRQQGRQARRFLPELLLRLLGGEIHLAPCPLRRLLRFRPGLVEDLLVQPLRLRLARLEDLLCFLLRRLQLVAVAGQQAFALFPCLLGLSDGLADALLPCFQGGDQRLPGGEPKHHEEDHEADHGPDHETRVHVHDARCGVLTPGLGKRQRIRRLSVLGQRWDRVAREEEERQAQDGAVHLLASDSDVAPPGSGPAGAAAPRTRGGTRAAIAHLLWIMKQMAQAKRATPSISAAVRIMLPRISPDASGWRAMLSTELAAILPIPMPAPITATPAPMPAPSNPRPSIAIPPSQVAAA